MSDGEYCCLMFISEENLKEKICKIEEDVSTDSESIVLTNNNYNKTCIDSQMSDNSLSSFSDSEFEDNIPLARLAKVYQREEADSYSDNFSDYESSGSEYQLTKNEKKILEESLSESDSDASIENLPICNYVTHNKGKMRCPERKKQAKHVLHNKKGKSRTNILKSTVFEHNTVEGDTGPVGVQMNIGLVGIEKGDGLVGVQGVLVK